tara:strand:- start:6226 stop:6555 length:330 start_codon:yes stop_codon:yes gene_type:complete
MTPDQLELLSDMVADKVFKRIQEYLETNYKDYVVGTQPLGPEEYFHKNVDAFGNVSYEPPQPPSKKEILGGQLKELEFKWNALLKEEKYELLQELKEIYEKIKKDYDNL